MTITIIYSSGGGNTKLVIDKIAHVLAGHGFEVEKINAITAQAQDIIKSQLTILAAPTYDHGVLHMPYEKFISTIEHSEHISLTSFDYAVIGLGDDKYDKEYNVESAKILEDFVTTKGGTLLTESLRINKSPVDRLDTIVHAWVNTLVTKIQQHD